MKVYLRLGTEQDEGTESGKLGDGRAFNTWLEVERFGLACFLISVVIFSHAVQLSGQNVRSCQSYDSFYSVVNKPLYELCK